MKQSRLMSLVESLANVLVGYGVAVATQILFFALFGLAVAITENLMIGLIFTTVSIVRSYALRRGFEALRVRQGAQRIADDAANTVGGQRLLDGYQCYLPTIPAEKLRRGLLTVADEPLFPRYLFIRLGQGDSAKSWAAHSFDQGR